MRSDVKCLIEFRRKLISVKTDFVKALFTLLLFGGFHKYSQLQRELFGLIFLRFPSQQKSSHKSEDC